MRDEMWREYQSFLNKKIRTARKNLEKDPLFRGRFTLYQINSKWHRFDDNSGGELFTTVRMFDKKTWYYKDYFVDYAPYLSTFDYFLNVQVINDFIMYESGFHDENPKNTIENAKDYTKVEVPYEFRQDTYENRTFFSKRHFDAPTNIND